MHLQPDRSHPCRLELEHRRNGRPFVQLVIDDQLVERIVLVERVEQFVRVVVELVVERVQFVQFVEFVEFVVEQQLLVELLVGQQFQLEQQLVVQLRVEQLEFEQQLILGRQLIFELRVEPLVRSLAGWRLLSARRRGADAQPRWALRAEATPVTRRNAHEAGDLNRDEWRAAQQVAAVHSPPMRNMITVVCGAALMLVPDVSAQSELPSALLAMADAERAFSARASATNWRDAFVEYFADEAVNFQPDPGPARERLRQVPAPKPGAPSFQWEPRTGDVAASGDLGYLTGPVRYPPSPDGKARYGCYFSVWKKQADGTFRVILDVGIQPPAEPPFAPGFVRAPSRATLTPAATRAEAETELLAADKAFSSALALQGAAPAFRAVMHPGARMHRNGFLPLTSRDAAVAWLETHVKAMTSTPMKSETGASGDLGYTWGQAVVTGADGKPTEGYYVRVWTLGDGGRWQLVADITPA